MAVPAYFFFKLRLTYIAAWSVAVGSGLAFSVLSSCRPNAPVIVLQTGYEDVYGVVEPQPEWLTDTVAHSGRWATQMLATADYAATITKSWAELSNPKQMRIGGWLWLPHGRLHTALVVQVERNGETIYYRIQPLNDVVKRYKQWQLVHQTHVLPPDMQDTDQVKIYLWQWGYHYKFYFDDLFVEKLR